MRVTVLVPDDGAIGRLAAYAKKALAEAGHEVVLMAHPPETLSGTFRSRWRRVGFVRAFDEAAYCIFEGQLTPWPEALERMGIDSPSDFDVRIQDTRTNELGCRLQALSSEILVVMGCTPINIRALPKTMLALNVHPGVLPRYRGVGNPEAMVRGGDSVHFGYTVHRLTEQLDEGEILLRKRCQLPLNFNAPRVYLSSYCAALEYLARRLGDAFIKSWPVEDDFTDIVMPEGSPLWRMTLTEVCSMKIKSIVKDFVT